MLAGLRDEVTQKVAEKRQQHNETRKRLEAKLAVRDQLLAQKRAAEAKRNARVESSVEVEPPPGVPVEELKAAKRQVDELRANIRQLEERAASGESRNVGAVDRFPFLCSCSRRSC